jgi:hypothetical protein
MSISENKLNTVKPAHVVINIVKPALRGHLWDNEKVALYGR